MYEYDALIRKPVITNYGTVDKYATSSTICYTFVVYERPSFEQQSNELECIVSNSLTRFLKIPK